MGLARKVLDFIRNNTQKMYKDVAYDVCHGIDYRVEHETSEYQVVTIDVCKEACRMALDHQWVSTKERLPEEEFDDGYTLVFVNIEIDEDTSRFDVDYIRDGHWEIHPDANITHWMTIPKIQQLEK